jgi:transposase
MGRLRLDEREAMQAFWRGHFEAWRLSGLNQREYCAEHGLSLKNFGNWRGQLKREAAAGRRARWGHHPRLRPSVSPSASPRTKEAEAEAIVAAAPGRRRRFGKEAKRRIVEEASQPGASVSGVARRYGIEASLLFRWRHGLGLGMPIEGATFLPVCLTDDGAASETPVSCDQPAPTPAIIVERPAAGIEIELIGGRRVRFDRDVDPETMRRVVTALEGTGP